MRHNRRGMMGKDENSAGRAVEGELETCGPSRIVMVVPSLEPMTGGVQADLEIATQLRARGLTVELVAIQRHSQLSARRTRWDRLTIAWRLIWRYRRLQRGAVILEDQGITYLLLPFNWYLRFVRHTPIVLLSYHLIFRGWRNPIRRAWRRWIEGAIARHADLVIASSENGKEELLELGISQEAIRVVPLGITVRARESQVRADSGERQVVRFLTVGTVEPRKGLEHLVEALATMRDLAWHLDIAGTMVEEYTLPLVRRIEACGLADRITMHGWVGDEVLGILLAHADVYVSPSLWEGFGLAVVEAMDAGLPVVASRAGALSELIIHGVTGILVPPAQPALLAEALRQMAADRSLRQTLGQAAKKAVAARFDWRVTGACVASTLCEALAIQQNRNPS